MTNRLIYKFKLIQIRLLKRTIKRNWQNKNYLTFCNPNNQSSRFSRISRSCTNPDVKSKTLLKGCLLQWYTVKIEARYLTAGLFISLETFSCFIGSAWIKKYFLLKSIFYKREKPFRKKIQIVGWSLCQVKDVNKIFKRVWYWLLWYVGFY